MTEVIEGLLEIKVYLQIKDQICKIQFRYINRLSDHFKLVTTPSAAIRLPSRSVLLLRRGVRRTPAPKHRGGNHLLST